MRINYLTWLRTRLDKESEIIELPGSVETIGDLMALLRKRNQVYNDLFSMRQVIFVELAGRIVGDEQVISNDMEISFFSPIVGG